MYPCDGGKVAGRRITTMFLDEIFNLFKPSIGANIYKKIKVQELVVWESFAKNGADLRKGTTNFVRAKD